MATRMTRRLTGLRPPSRLKSVADRMDLGSLPKLTGYALRRAQLAVFEDFIATFAPVGLRPAQFSALLVIQRNPGRKQSEIASALGIKQANFVGLMDELDQRRLTRRIRSSADRRSHALTLTAKGEALLQKAFEALTRHEQRLVDCLGAREHEQLRRLLARLSGLNE